MKISSSAFETRASDRRRFLVSPHVQRPLQPGRQGRHLLPHLHRGHKGLIVHAWVIMSNHMHLIARAREGHDISAIIRDFKKFTAKAIVKQIKEEPESRREWMLRHFAFRATAIERVKDFKFWEDGSHAILLDTPLKWEQRFSYLHNNPVKGGLVAEPHHYLLSSALDYAGIKGLVNIDMEW